MNQLRLAGIRALKCATLMAGAGLIMLPAAATGQQPPQGNTVIGPPQLRDFQIEPRQRIVTQPRTPQTAQPEPVPPPAEQRTRQPGPTSGPSRAAGPSAPPRAPVQALPSGRQQAPTGQGAPAPAPAGETPSISAPADFSSLPPAPVPAPEAPVAAPAPSSNGPSAPAGPPLWLYLLGGLALSVVGYGLIARRRASERRALALPAPEMRVTQPLAPRTPRPDPVPRPWLEVELTAERAKADPDESVVEFELTVRNSGGSAARNVKLQAKLICSTPDQDKEIAAFHRKKPGEHRTLPIPDIPAGQELRLKGQVDIKRADIRALRVEQRLLFIPLVAVNAFYEWGTGRSGQTSRSFLVGREKAEPADKMAPFRLDLGPRVYRTVGQRPYKVERRV